MANPEVTNTTPNLVGRQLLTTTDAAQITGLLTFSLSPAAPFAVQAASAKVPNLNANTIHGSTAASIIAGFVAAPTGAMMPFCSATIPSGWLLCNGQLVSTATYANLFAVLGTSYGSGSGTFGVPDCRQRVPLGVSLSGTGSILGGTGGSIGHTHTYNQVITHTHTVSITDPGHDHTTHEIYNDSQNTNLGGGGQFWLLPSGYVSPGANTTGITMSTANPSGGVSSGTTAGVDPPWLAVNYIIKT